MNRHNLLQALLGEVFDRGTNFTGIARREDFGERVNLAVRNNERNEVKTGPGVRRRRTPHGTTVAMNGRTFGWDNPFAVYYYGSQSQINFGTINGMYPTIKGKSIKPDSKGVFPMLTMQKFSNAASYVVVEVTRNKTNTTGNSANNLPLIQSMEVLHVQNLNDQMINQFFGGALGFPELPGNKTRLPLARIETQQFGNACIQVAMFNYQYTIKIVNGKARNYFYPQ